MLIQADHEAAVQIARGVLDEEGCDPEYFSVVQAVETYAHYSEITYTDQKVMCKLVMDLIQDAVISITFPSIDEILKKEENAKTTS